MEISRLGDAYTINDDKGTYVVKGDLIKTIEGPIIINLRADEPGNSNVAISTLNGNYNDVSDELVLNLTTKVSKYNEQIDMIQSMLDAIKAVLVNQNV